MKVLKFGGTSVGTPASLSNVKRIVEGITEPAVIVVSALGGVTDLLIGAAKFASALDENYKEKIAVIVRRHHEMIEVMVQPDKRAVIREVVERMLSQLEEICRGLTLVKALPEQTLNNIVALGERMSSVIVAASVNGAIHVDSLEVIKTERWFNRNIIDAPLTTKLLVEKLSDLKSGAPVIMGGFIARDHESGEITNLGRGGSDYTGAIVAAAMDADVLEIWTDVDGFMSADPRIIPQAKVLPSMSFVESMELCSFGAKVIYPPSIFPVFHKNIPIRILNTLRPEASGTWITDHPSGVEGMPMVKGISAIRTASMITVHGEATANLAEINARIFNTLAKQSISVLLVSQTSVDDRVVFAVSAADGPRSAKVLLSEFAPDIAMGRIRSVIEREDVSVVAVVGENINGIPNIRARVFASLEKEGVKVLGATFGTSQTTLSFIVEETETLRAMQILHHELIEE